MYREINTEQKIADLERLLRERQDDLELAHRTNKELREERFKPLLTALVDPVWWCILVFVTAAAAGIWKVASSSGKIDYCYVDSGMSESKRTLNGHRPWRPDASLRSMPIAEDPAPLFALAKELDCPLR